MVNQSSLEALRADLMRRGLPRRYVRRVVDELADHQEDLLVAGQRYYTVSGPLSTERDSQSHLNTETGRARVRSLRP